MCFLFHLMLYLKVICLWKAVNPASLDVPGYVFPNVVGSQGNIGVSLYCGIPLFLKVLAKLYRLLLFLLLSSHRIFFHLCWRIFAYKMLNQRFFTNQLDS